MGAGPLVLKGLVFKGPARTGTGPARTRLGPGPHLSTESSSPSKTGSNPVKPLAKARVRGGLVPAREMDTANPLEFGGDRKTIGKL